MRGDGKGKKAATMGEKRRAIRLGAEENFGLLGTIGEATKTPKRDARFRRWKLTYYQIKVTGGTGKW